MDLFKIFGTILLDGVDKAKKQIQEISFLSNAAAASLQNVGGKVQKVGDGISGVGKKLMPATLAIAGAGAAMVNYASDSEESLNKVRVAFGDASDSVEDFASTALTSYGIAEGTALDLASLFGDMGTSMGLTTAEAAEMSTSLVGLAGDLASFKNIGIDQAQNALKGIFTGETESLKSLGVVMTQTQLDAYALANGFEKTTSEMTQSELVALRYAFVMDATANAQGDFARTSDGTANQMRIATESVKELAASFGTFLLPIVAKVLTAANNVMQKFSEMDDGTKKLILTIGAVVAAIGPALIIIGKITSGIGALVSVIPLLISPIGLVVLAITAVITAIVLCIKHWDEIKAKVIEVAQIIVEKVSSLKDRLVTLWGNIKSTVASTWASIKTTVANKASEIFTAVSTKFNNIKNKITETIEAARDKVKSAIDKMRSFFKFDWSLPKIKLPHFKINGSFSLNPPSVPSFGVEWYKKGGVLEEPTIFGMNGNKLMGGGEAGAEAVAPIDVLQGYVAEAVASQNAGMVSVLEKILDAILTMDANMGGNLREALDGTSFSINHREFGRLVKAVN